MIWPEEFLSGLKSGLVSLEVPDTNTKLSFLWEHEQVNFFVLVLIDGSLNRKGVSVGGLLEESPRSGS